MTVRETELSALMWGGGGRSCETETDILRFPLIFGNLLNHPDLIEFTGKTTLRKGVTLQICVRGRQIPPKETLSKVQLF